MINQIYNEDCLETMGRIPNNFVDLVLTSPPYDNMRQYGGNKTYHQRLKDTGFSFQFEEISKELSRILKVQKFTNLQTAELLLEEIKK